MGELRAILVTLQVIKEQGWTRVIVNSDSQKAVNKFVIRETTRDANFIIVQQCRDLLTEMQDIELKFEARGTNQVADRMARMCRTDVIANYNLCSIEQAPEFVLDLLMEEMPP